MISKNFFSLPASTAGHTFELCINGITDGVSSIKDNNYWANERGIIIPSFYNESYPLACDDGDCGCVLNEAKKLSESRISSLVFSYKSNPCLLEDDKFFAVLLFESIRIIDNGIYTLNFEDHKGKRLQVQYNMSAS